MKIDWWTLGFQTVNIVVLVGLLQHFFWNPVAATIAQRVASTRKAIDDAAARTKEAQDMLAGFVETREGFGAERAAILEAAHKAAEKDRGEQLAEGTRQAESLLAKAKAQAEKDSRAAEKAWTDRAGTLAVRIAQRLLAGLDGAALRGAFLDRLVRQLHDLKPKERDAIAADGAALDAVSAEALDSAEQKAFGSAVLGALQTRPLITFKVDSTLIAGLELRAPHAVVSNSLHADLDRILLELTHDDSN